MRFLFVLMVMAVAACLIFAFPNLPGHNALVAGWDSLERMRDSSPLRFLGFTSNVSTTRSLAERVLRPLEAAPPANEEEDIAKTIADIRANAGSSASATNINAALNLIQQAYEERKYVVQTLSSSTRTPTLWTPFRITGAWSGNRKKSLTIRR